MSDIIKTPSRTPATKSNAKIAYLQEMSEAIKLHGEIFSLSEHEIKHLRKAFFYSEIENGLVPDAFKGDYRSIFVMSQLCETMKCDLIEVLQGGYFVHGRWGWYAEFQIKRALALGIYTVIDYEQTGDIKAGTYAVRAVGTRPDGSKAIGTSVSIAMAQAEKWTKNSKYQTMPVLMLKKRAASFLIRETAPHIFGGQTITAEELTDLESKAVVNVNPTTSMDALLSMLSESGGVAPEIAVDEASLSSDPSVNPITEEKSNVRERDSDRY